MFVMDNALGGGGLLTSSQTFHSTGFREPEERSPHYSSFEAALGRSLLDHVLVLGPSEQVQGFHGSGDHCALELHPHQVLHRLRRGHLRYQPVLVLAYVRSERGRHSQRYGSGLGQLGRWRDPDFYDVSTFQPDG